MDNENVYPDLLWAGTEHALALAQRAELRAAGFEIKGDAGNPGEEDVPYLYSLQGQIGVIQIAGPLVSQDRWYNQFLGVTSYADIRRAMIHASSDPQARAILLDINSGGGAVNGVADVGDLIAAVDQQIKPVYAFTDGTMASAAYWLGVSAREVYGSRVATMGSVGVILTHMEYSKALKEAGVGVTVMRSGQYKALVNSVEPLTKTATEQLQAQLDAAYNVFIGHVAARRGMTVEQADATIGQGREFFGQQAVAAGAIDGIESYDSMMSRIEAKLLDNSGVTQNNGGNYSLGLHPMTKKALTEQQIAAAAAAGIVPPAAETPAEQAPTAETPEASAEQTPAAAPAAESKDGSALVDFLKGELKATQDDNVKLQVRAQAAEDQVASMKAAQGALTAIVARSLSQMKVALGMPAADLSKLSTEALLADHAATAESFKSMFKAGGVAAVTPADDKSAPAVDPNRAARLKATRIN